MIRPWWALLLLLVGCAAEMDVHVELAESGETVLTRDLHRRCFVTQVDIGDGVERPFLVDTGASVCVIDTELMARVIGEDVEPGELHRLDQVRVGPLRARHVRSLAHDMTDLATAFGRPLDGIVGFPVFSPVLLELDFPAREIRLRRGSLPEPDGRWILPMRSDRTCPYVEITVAGERIPVLLDTGAGSGLALEQLPLEHLRSPPRRVTSVVTIHGREDRFGSRLDHDVRFGPATLRKPFVSQHDPSLIGCGVLRHFVVTFDQRNRRVRLFSRRDVIRR